MTGGAGRAPKTFDQPEDRYGSKAYRGWVLAMLTGVYFFYLLDRNALLVTQELLKAEFKLTDTQLGLVSGTVYAAAYGLAGLPIGWLTDRVNRRRLLSAILATWSALTAVCGFAGGYWHLFAARFGVGAAESGGAPTSLAILSDIYPAEKRGAVAGVFFAGAGVGVFVSFLAGGFIAAEFGWRAVFLLYGAPGLVLALLLLVTLRDPPAGAGAEGGASKPLGLGGGLAAIGRSPPLVALYLGCALFTLSMNATGSWLMSFLMRVHHVDLKLGGTIVAVALGLFGIAGSILIGAMSDKARRSGPAGPFLAIAVVALINMTFGLFAVMAGELWLVVACLCIWGATSMGYSAPANAIISQAAPPGARGVGFALFALISNVVGTGLGAIFVGYVSDLSRAAYGENSLRPALVLVLLAQLATACAFVAGGVLTRRAQARHRAHP